MLGAGVGVIAGAAIAYLVIGANGAEHSAASRAPPPENAPRAVPDRAPARGGAVESTADRAALYRLAADAGAAELEPLVAEAGALPPSAARDLRLGALLGRYAEIDAARAVTLGREFELPAGTLAPLYAAWAVRAPEAALAALRKIDAPTAAGTIALAMLPALDGDRAFERTVAALGVAPTPPNGYGLGQPPVDPGMVALDRLAEGLARQDLRAALAQLEEIRAEPARSVFRAAVLREWGRSDPAAVLEYIATLDATAQQLAVGTSLRELARAEPQRALEIAARLSEGARRMVEQVAVQRLAETDARAALRYAETLPGAGPQRRQLLQTIAGFYGKQDPDAALAWARDLAGEQGVLAAVVGGIAATNPARAFELAASLPATERFQAVQSTVMNGLRPGGDAAAMADRILELRPELRTMALSTLFSFWTFGQSEDALDWLTRNGDRVPVDAYRDAARQIANRFPATAARYVSQVPPAVRPDWIAAVAQALAQNDAQAGVTWLERFRGQAGYGEGVATLTQVIAQSDPPRAARLLATVDGPLRESSSSVQVIANQWAQRDPAAAARWVLDLETPAARAAAIQILTATWALDNLPAARSWALQLATGLERDAALMPVFASGVASGAPPDRAIAAAFSSSAALAGAVTNAAAQLAYVDAVRARALVAEYVTDRAQRERAEKIIDQIQTGAPGQLDITVR